jgi:PhnB protein
VFARATAPGAAVKQPLRNQFYGHRSAAIADPFGHIWAIASQLEEFSPKEMRRGMAAMAPGTGA